MDSIACPAGPDIWSLESTDGIVLGAIERRPDGFFIVPVPSAQLGDLDPLPYVSLEAALEGVGAHLQGICTLSEAEPGRGAGAP